MGNRCVIVPKGVNMCVYLHWNGGPCSVIAFLEYCRMRGFRSFEDDYGFARFCQVVGNFFGGDLSLGAGTFDAPDPNTYKHGDYSYLDNGVYVVKDWDIVEHYGSLYYEDYDMFDLLCSIDDTQLVKDKLGQDKIAHELGSREDEIYKLIRDMRECSSNMTVYKAE